MRLGKRWFAWLGAIVLTTTMVIVIYRFNYPSFAEVARFSSPDRRWECVVYECPPPGFYYSPYQYRFEIRDGTGRLVGREMEMANDSSALEFSRAEWGPAGVVLRCAPGQGVVCRFSGSSTEWQYHAQYSPP